MHVAGLISYRDVCGFGDAAAGRATRATGMNINP